MELSRQKYVLLAIVFITGALSLVLINAGWGLAADELAGILISDSEVLGETAGTFTVQPQWETAQVKKVIDGDTIELVDGRKLRYIGIDTPETKAPNTPVECYGQQAAAFNDQLVTGQLVRLEKDVNDTDRYGRLLRYVYLGDQMVNELLVAEGYAVASSYPPDIAHQDLFRQAEAEARAMNKGLWGSCPLPTE